MRLGDRLSALSGPKIVLLVTAVMLVTTATSVWLVEAGYSLTVLVFMVGDLALIGALLLEVRRRKRR